MDRKCNSPQTSKARRNRIRKYLKPALHMSIRNISGFNMLNKWKLPKRDKDSLNVYKMEDIDWSDEVAIQDFFQDGDSDVEYEFEVFDRQDIYTKRTYDRCGSIVRLWPRIWTWFTGWPWHWIEIWGELCISCTVYRWKRSLLWICQTRIPLIF